MAEEQGVQGTEQVGAEAAQPEGTDYKALCEQLRADNEKLKAESRKWEKRSKENLDTAKQAESAAKKSVEEEVAGLKAKLKQMEDEQAHARLVASVAKAKNVPAELLRGKDEDELNAFADQLAEFAKRSVPSTPADKGGAAQPKPLTKAQIAAIKDPKERRKAIRENITLFMN